MLRPKHTAAARQCEWTAGMANEIVLYNDKIVSDNGLPFLNFEPVNIPFDANGAESQLVFARAERKLGTGFGDIGLPAARGGTIGTIGTTLVYSRAPLRGSRCE